MVIRSPQVCVWEKSAERRGEGWGVKKKKRTSVCSVYLSIIALVWLLIWR